MALLRHVARLLGSPCACGALWLLVLSPMAFAAEPIQVPTVVSLIHDVSVASPQAGVLASLHVREGDAVEEGTLLAELDDDDARLECERMQAELSIAQAEAGNQLKVQLAEKALAVAGAELERAEKSHEKYADSVSATELDKLRFARDQAQLQIENAKHELELAAQQVRLKRAELALAELQLERRRLRAPLRGIVVKVERQPGEWIQAGETFCRIIRTDRVRAEGFVNIKDGLLQPGQSVLLRLNIDGSAPQLFDGTLTFIDPEVNSVNGVYRVWAEIDNPQGTLRPGHRPTMSISPAVQAADSRP